MNPIEERLNAIDARLAARAAELERRIAARYGDAAGAPRPAPEPRPDGDGLLLPGKTVRRGLFVGLGEYDPVKIPPESAARIRSCVQDAKTFADICRSTGGWSDARLLLDSRATLAGIRDAVRSLASDTRPGELALLFVSTHGLTENSFPGANDTALLAYDGLYFEKDLFSDLACFRRGARLLVVVNACHSGGLFEKTRGAGDFARRFLENIETVGRFAGGTRDGDSIAASDIAAIAAAARDQTSIGTGVPGNCSSIPAALVQEGWRDGMADGFTTSIVSVNGEDAVRSADAVCRVENRALPQKTGFVSFLDMALYAVWTWKDISHVQFSNGPEAGFHIPQFYNAGLLSRVVAGPVGMRRGSDGAPAMSRPTIPASPPSRSATPFAGSFPRRSGTRYGLFVGVNHSPCGAVLSGCVNDANDLRAACIELGGWRPADARVLEDASKDEFLSQLAALASVAKPGDEVLVSFSGHGGCHEGGADDDFEYAMSDGPLAEREFRKVLSRFNAAVRIVVVVDACKSDAAAVAGPAGSILPSNVGWIVASTSWQNSSDGFQGRKNGFLTGALLDGWRSGGAAGMADHAKSAEGGKPVAFVPDSVTFLDLAVFVAHSWRYWHPGEQQPQYHNPAVLSAVLAGRVGTPGGSRGADPETAVPKDTIYHLYCDKCGHKWYSSHWDNYCPKYGCTGRAHKL